jgi:hypothetical protein
MRKERLYTNDLPSHDLNTSSDLLLLRVLWLGHNVLRATQLFQFMDTKMAGQNTL